MHTLFSAACAAAVFIHFLVASARAQEQCQYELQRLDIFYYIKDITGYKNVDSRNIFRPKVSHTLTCQIYRSSANGADGCLTVTGGSVVGVRNQSYGNNNPECIQYDGFNDRAGNYIEFEKSFCFSDHRYVKISPQGATTTGNERTVDGGSRFSDDCRLPNSFWTVSFGSRYDPDQRSYKILGVNRDAYVGTQSQGFYKKIRSLYEGPKGAF